MLKVSSMSSHTRLPQLPDTSESGILNHAMVEETAIQSTPTGHVSMPTNGSGARHREEASTTEEAEPPNKRIKADTSISTQGNLDQTQESTPRSTNGTGNQPPAVSQSASIASDRCSESGTTTSSTNGESSIVTNESDASNSSDSNSSLHEPTSAGPQEATSSGTSQIEAASSLASVPPPVISPPNTSTASHSDIPPVPPSPGPTPQPLPKKATTMEHLRLKYLDELEYMLREFRKLERQLLGAKGAAQLEESTGSRERREKLHSFILHLEDTIRQIEEGCALQANGQSIVVDGMNSGDQGVSTKQESEVPGLDNASDKKNDEETVQKLEEHILANLLPVKVRLKKQLAAQQGASRNPPGMPAPRRGNLQPSVAAMGKGTFAAAAEERRKQAEAARLAAQQQHDRTVRRVSDPSHFGKPLGGGGSSLTQKLHGATLGSEQRAYGHGVGSSCKPQPSSDTAPKNERKILYAGMVPQSKQHQSGVSAASGAHELVIEDQNLIQRQAEQQEHEFIETGTAAAAHTSSSHSGPVLAHPSTKPIPRSSPTATPQRSHTLSTRKELESFIPPLAPEGPKKSIRPHEDESLSEQERRRLRKKRRKRKLRRIARRRERERLRQVAMHQQAQVAHGGGKTSVGKKKSSMNKAPGKKKGPRAVEYICALCSEAYASTCDFNPWWALAQHECPKCRKTQVPRIDIASPANTIEYHPALLAHADDNGGGGGGGDSAAPNASVMHVAQPASTYKPPLKAMKDSTSSVLDSESDSDLSELSDGYLSELSMDSDDDTTDLPSMSPAEQAEHESFGYEYKGPSLTDRDASRLLVLMSHASTCPCKHKLSKHRDVCMSVKYMMLHVRDCPGTTATFDVCPFPWCRKVKHLLYHLVSCQNPKECPICSPKDLSSSLRNLVGLNAFRMKSKRQRMIATARASLAAKPKPPPATNARISVVKVTTKKHADSSKVAISETKMIHPYQKVTAYSKATAQVQIKSDTVGAARTSPAPSTSLQVTTKHPAIQSVKLHPSAGRSAPSQNVTASSIPATMQGKASSASSAAGINLTPSAMPTGTTSSLAQPKQNVSIKVEPAALPAKQDEPTANAASVVAPVTLQPAPTIQGSVITQEGANSSHSGNTVSTNPTSTFSARVNNSDISSMAHTATEGEGAEVSGTRIQFVASVDGLQALANEISAGNPNSDTANLGASGMAELETLVGIPTLPTATVADPLICAKEENLTSAASGTSSVEPIGNTVKTSSIIQVPTTTEVVGSHHTPATLAPSHAAVVLTPAEAPHEQIEVEPAGGTT